MRKTVVVLLIVSLLVPRAYATGKPKAYSWADAKRLRVGKEISVTLIGGSPARVRLWHIDDTTLVTSPPATRAKLPRDLQDVPGMLAELGERWGQFLRGGEIAFGSIRITNDGVFKNQEKLADLNVVVQIVPRDRVAAIEVGESHTLRWVLLSAAVVVGLAFLFVLATAPG